MKRIFPLSALLLLTATGACSPGANPDEQLRTRVEALQGRDERLLDVAFDGALLSARELPAPPDSDASLQLVVRLLTPDGATVDLAGPPLRDARFVPGSREIFGVSSDGELLRFPSPSETPLRLDTQAHGPLAITTTRLVYARGEAPDLEIAAWDRASGQVRSLTSGMAPAWSPAASEDGAVVFVSAQTGFPELYALENGAPRKVTDRAGREAIPFPSSPLGPRLVQGVLYFEDQGAAHGVDTREGKLVWSLPQGGTPFPLRPGKLLLARTRGAEVVQLHGSGAR